MNCPAGYPVRVLPSWTYRSARARNRQRVDRNPAVVGEDDRAQRAVVDPQPFDGAGDERDVERRELLQHVGGRGCGAGAR